MIILPCLSEDNSPHWYCAKFVTGILTEKHSGVKFILCENTMSYYIDMVVNDCYVMQLQFVGPPIVRGSVKGLPRYKALRVWSINDKYWMDLPGP
jgi:hypothetical protein